MAKDKRPKASLSPVVSKQPRAVEARSYHDLHPSWRIARMDFVDPFGWHRIGSEEIAIVRSKLGQFETRTWANILVDDKKRNHSVRIDSLCKEARDRLREMFRGNIDIDDLVSLRLSGKERVWGILDQGVLTVLWWDPEHAVCPSLKD